MRVPGRNIEGIVFWWTFGLALAYIFLIGLIAWLVFQGILIFDAFQNGNQSYIDWKLGRYLFIAVVYFAIGGFLRVIRFI